MFNVMKKIVLGVLFKDKAKLGKLIASKFDIPGVSEKHESELAEKMLEIMEAAFLEIGKK
tara:strand:- start:1414 stop:1593 length:180 start_codon:yes stop_codon:yes gene_type:complete